MPVAVAEHHRVRRPGRIVGRRKPAPDFGPHAERRQDSRARRQRDHLLGIAVASDRRRFAGAPDPYVFKGLSVVRVGRIDHVVEVRLIDAADRVDDPNQRVRIGIGQRVDEHAVHDAENRRGGADAERERDDRRGGEARLLP